MTYSLDFRKQVLRSINEGMSVKQAAVFYQISTSTIHSWTKALESKNRRNKPPTKILDMVLLDDIAAFPNDFQYQRAQRLSCSNSGVYYALKRLDSQQKKVKKD
ncbi:MULTISPECIES: IS630 transposase-related protein [Psychrobacter]|uniref:IS630 transposase-related protein n=1 Tax=Psychrobacter TaxID=497 RepID=UPI001918DDD2|nr:MULTISPECIES: IS630 transposase-related protein [Psychrobacter]